MESPKITYEALKRIDNIEDLAHERLFENYLELNLSGYKKKIDIESTDQESILKKFAQGRPIPGMVYTFIHINENTLEQIENYKTGRNVQFHDLSPILFCTSFNVLNHSFKGLNMNMLPKEERLKFFQAYWEHYKTFFDRVEEKTEYDKLAINRNYFLASMMGQNPKLFEHFNRSQGAKFNYAYRSYILKNVRRLRMIEYEEWKFIPFFDARESFKRTNLEDIYRAYYDNKNKT